MPRAYDSARAAASAVRRAAHASLQASTLAALRTRCTVALRLRLPMCPGLCGPGAQGLGREQHAATAMLRRGGASRATAAAPWCGATCPRGWRPRGTDGAHVLCHNWASHVAVCVGGRKCPATFGRFSAALLESGCCERRRTKAKRLSQRNAEHRRVRNASALPGLSQTCGTKATACHSAAPTLCAHKYFHQTSASVTLRRCYHHARNASHACVGKHSAPGMKTWEGSDESARASARGRLATSRLGGVAFVPCEAAEGS